jgi:hypothetical protein
MDEPELFAEDIRTWSGPFETGTEKLIDESRSFRIVFVLTVTAMKWSRAPVRFSASVSFKAPAVAMAAGAQNRISRGPRVL